MRPAAGQSDFFDRPAAFSAGLAAAAVDFQVGNEAAARPVAPPVIARRGATLGNGQAENFFDRAAEFLNFRQPQSFEPPGRAKPGGETTFININIAQTGNQGLIKQDLF